MAISAPLMPSHNCASEPTYSLDNIFSFYETRCRWSNLVSRGRQGTLFQDRSRSALDLIGHWQTLVSLKGWPCPCHALPRILPRWTEDPNNRCTTQQKPFESSHASNCDFIACTKAYCPVLGLSRKVAFSRPGRNLSASLKTAGSLLAPLLRMMASSPPDCSTFTPCAAYCAAKRAPARQT